MPESLPVMLVLASMLGPVPGSSTSVLGNELAWPAVQRSETVAEGVSPSGKFDDDNQLWIVNTRHLGCDCAVAEADPIFDVHRCDFDHGWQLADLEMLLRDDDPARVTAVFVHGNRIESDEVTRKAWEAYDSFACRVDPGVPLQLVFWSWPSDRIRGQLRDVRAKMRRADCEARYLAEFLAQRNSTGRLVLVGYSFGARVIAGALHLLAGGNLTAEELPLESAAAPVSRPSVTFLAPAIPNHSLLPTGSFSLAATQTERLLVLYNSLDPVLKRFWLIDPHIRPQALGYTGSPVDTGDDTRVFQQVDMRHQIGRSHSDQSYFQSADVVELLRQQIRGVASGFNSM